MATVLVVDEATSVRETLRIVLGHEHDVRAVSTLADLPSRSLADVVVLGLPARPRDERAVGAEVERALPGVPLLLLHAAREIDAGTLVPPDVPVEFLPKPFDAYAVRARVRTLLGARPDHVSADVRREAARCRLEFPFLSHSAAAVVRRVLMADLPVVLLHGEPGTGAAGVARALHVVRGAHGAFAMLDGADVARGDVAPAATGAATLYVAHLDRASSEVQAEVLRLVDECGADGSTRRLIVGTETDLCELAAAGRFSPELAYVASALPIVLAPLRDRPDDVPALAETITQDLRARLRLEAVTYRPAALERLRHYLWFGNVAELEAVLTRTLTLHRPSVVEAEQLVFLPEAAAEAVAERTTAAPAVGRPTVAPLGSTEALAGLDLEVVLGELAHELRNPMVTIKTVAQHLDGVLADPEARARFSVLMAEAVGRMDGLLETLLDFARFRAPLAQSVDVEKVLDRVLAEHAEDLGRRHVRVERNGSGVGIVRADEAQVSFALRSLCRGLVPDLVPHTALVVHGAAPGVLEVRVQTDPSVAARLTAWVEPHANGATETPPLAWALAAALLERNGGALTVHKGDAEAMVIRVTWRERAS
jgi:DNA-binding NtrC family response regulator